MHDIKNMVITPETFRKGIALHPLVQGRSEFGPERANHAVS